MTLLEILVRELPKRGGWPDGAELASISPSGNVYFVGRTIAPFIAISHAESGYRWERITRDQYINELAAVEPEWNGEGLPPVGVNCEIIFEDDTPPKWYSFVATFVGSNHIVALVGMEELTYKKGEILRPGVKFRPIRSEADRKRDELAKSLHVAAGAAPVEHCGIGPLYLKLADKIIAGEVPQLKIV